MRANGIPEEKITGNATAEEKFAAWAQTVEPASVTLSITGPIWNLNTILTLMTR